MLITSVTPLSPCTTGTSPQLFHDLRNFALRMLGCNLGLKCAHSQAERCTAGTGRKVVANVSETAKGTVAESSKNRRGYTDVQGAPRFPIKLPVALKSAAAAAGVTGSAVAGSGVMEKTVETENISANGVLFRMDADVPPMSSARKPTCRWIAADEWYAVLKMAAGAESAWSSMSTVLSAGSFEVETRLATSADRPRASATGSTRQVGREKRSNG